MKITRNTYIAPRKGVINNAPINNIKILIKILKCCKILANLNLTFKKNRQR